MKMKLSMELACQYIYIVIATDIFLTCALLLFGGYAVFEKMDSYVHTWYAAHFYTDTSGHCIKVTCP